MSNDYNHVPMLPFFLGLVLILVCWKRIRERTEFATLQSNLNSFYIGRMDPSYAGIFAGQSLLGFSSGETPRMFSNKQLSYKLKTSSSLLSRAH